MTVDLSLVRWTIVVPVVCLNFGSATAQDPTYRSLSQPIALIAPTTEETPAMAGTLQATVNPKISHAVAPTEYGRSDLPASITDPSGTLSLETGGPYVFDPLPIKGNGCRPRPIISCTGPDFCGCTKRIYYGTNPCDDDPVLPLSQTGCDPKTKHWYQHAYDMVIRKKSVTEFFK
ncbi:hypothetical protein [Roseimaritima ulvae]|uniref:Uncharacterized protein n=1 Tax=Roseimaritima ulvae TaxID=980254 RepID=A0A5B9QQ82_9BACT|nr:hypothetical protein [Roseimaritima ulvae]QEG41257.1 hypothetical protein UC8_32760 [Roseimaritima ulvae]